MIGLILMTIGIFMGYRLCKFVNTPEISAEELHRITFNSGLEMGKIRGRIQAKVWN